MLDSARTEQARRTAAIQRMYNAIKTSHTHIARTCKDRSRKRCIRKLFVKHLECGADSVVLICVSVLGATEVVKDGIQKLDGIHFPAVGSQGVAFKYAVEYLVKISGVTN